MNSIWKAIASLIIFFLSCRFYSKFTDERTFRLDQSLNLRLISLLSRTIWLKRQARWEIFTSISTVVLIIMATRGMFKQLNFEWLGLGEGCPSDTIFYEGHYSDCCYLDFDGIVEFTAMYKKNNYY